MKSTILISIFFLLFIFSANGQRHDRGDRPMHKIQQLEKIKLLEVLELEEDTFVRFFSRLNDHREKMFDLEKKEEVIIDKLENEISSGDKSGLNKFIDEYILLDQKRNDEKKSFLNSLNDIMTTEQIGKFIVFEKNFKREIREILMREKGRRMKKR